MDVLIIIGKHFKVSIDDFLTKDLSITGYISTIEDQRTAEPIMDYTVNSEKPSTNKTFEQRLKEIELTIQQFKLNYKKMSVS